MKGNIKWLITLFGAIVFVVLFRNVAFTSCSIPSTGMENSLFCGERILVNQWSYGLRAPLMSLFPYQRWVERVVRKEDIVVFNNPANVLQPVIDQREVYISRCAGVPGDTLLVDSHYSIISSTKAIGPDQKRLYTYPREREAQVDSLLSILAITSNELMGQDSVDHVRSFSRYEYYLLDQAMRGNRWILPLEKETLEEVRPLIIPGKGRVVRVYDWNRTLLLNTLVLHEGRQAEIKNDTLYVDGRPTQHCYFTKDYYWMVSNNSVNLSDSRLFGFVPHDHLIGKAALIWFSKESGGGVLGGYRWKRFFQPIQ